MGRDALCVDIAVSSQGEAASKKSIRLCTTHLESLYDGGRYRSSQLAAISDLLKATEVTGHNNIAGIVGGDMNAIGPEEHQLHKTMEVNLKDAWEDISPPPIPKRSGRKDLTFGRARGNTWGYQSRVPRSGKRFDKFYYTGQLETIPLTEGQDVTGKISRIGIGCKTEVEAWEYQSKVFRVVRGEFVEKTETHYLSKERAKNKPDVRFVKIDHWVSDHFGIAVGIKVTG